MANPFDDIVNVENQKSTHNSRESPRRKDEITLSINKRFMERAIFVIIILVLGGLVLFNPWNTCNIDDSSITANVVNEQEELPETKVEVETVNEVEEKVEEEPVDEEVVEEEKDKPISGNLLLNIGNVDYAENEDGDPLKIEKLTFTITNNWKTFSPRIEVYMYDTFAPVEISEKIRVNKVLATAVDGKSYTYSVVADEFSMKYFYPDDDMEVILVKLFDRTTGEQLTYAKKNIP